MRESWIKFDEEKLRNGLQAWAERVFEKTEVKEFGLALDTSHKVISSGKLKIDEFVTVYPTARNFVEGGSPLWESFPVNLGYTEREKMQEAIVDKLVPLCGRDALADLAKLDLRHFCSEVWEQARPLAPGEDHWYLREAGIEGTHGLRVAQHEHDDYLLVPACDRNGVFREFKGYSFDVEKAWDCFEEDDHKEIGRLEMYIGDPPHGLSYRLNGSSQSNTVILASGFREAATLNELTKHTCIVCFDGENMPKVAEQFVQQQKQRPDLKFVVTYDGSCSPDESREKAASLLKASLIAPKGAHNDQYRRFWHVAKDRGQEACKQMLKEVGLEPVKERARSQEFFRAVG